MFLRNSTLFLQIINFTCALFLPFHYLATAEPPQSGGAPNNSQNGGHSTSHAMANQAMPMVPIPGQAVGAVSGVPGPTTNLNIGMDYWGSAQSSSRPAMLGGKVPATTGIPSTGSRDNMQSQLWIQVSLPLSVCAWYYLQSV